MSWLLRSGGLFSCRWFFRGRGLRRRFRLRFPAPAGARIVEFWRALAGCGFSAPQLSRGVVLRDGLVGFSGFCFRRFRRSSFVCVHGPSAVGSSVRVSADPLLVDFGLGLPTRLPGRHLAWPGVAGRSGLGYWARSLRLRCLFWLCLRAGLSGWAVRLG